MKHVRAPKTAARCGCPVRKTTMLATYRKVLCLLIALGGVGRAEEGAAARVVTAPAPAGERLSAEYQVTAGEQTVPVYTARVLDPPFAGKEWDYGGPYAFANFDMGGRVVVQV